MSWFFVVAVILSLIIAFYLGCRTIKLFNLSEDGYFNTRLKKIYWLLIIIGSLSFIVSRAISTIFDYWLPLVSNIVFSLVLCFFFAIVIIDCIRIISFMLLRKHLTNSYILQGSYVVISIGLFVIGLYMAGAPRVVVYQIEVDKPAVVPQLKIVQLSDIHLNEMTSRHYIKNMVEDVNNLNPDYIFITGDTLDLRLKPYVDNNFAELFAQLNSTYGTFIILGNHEHYGIEREDNNSQQAVIEAFSSGNMHVLLDEVFYDHHTGITIVGRDDYVVGNLNKTRLTLDELFRQVDSNSPVLLLDHQPRNLDDASQFGVDVMYSGHTHAGQIFPITLLVNLMYKNPWGVYHLSSPGIDFTSVVSSGYGLWGPPVRLMSRAEIVVTELKFNQQQTKQ